MKHYWKKEEDDFLINNIKGISIKELTNLFNKKFDLKLSESSISNRKHKLGIYTEYNSGCFKKGNIPANKGKKQIEYMTEEQIKKTIPTRFKKGNIPKNHRQVGSERTNVDGYIEIKVAEPNKWQLKHRVIYQQFYGEIPEGYNVIFLDRNKQNLNINNLKLVSKEEDLIMNRNNLFSEDKDITETGTIIANVISKTNKSGDDK